jgi:hypothetical protein
MMFSVTQTQDKSRPTLGKGKTVLYGAIIQSVKKHSHLLHVSAEMPGKCHQQ